MIKQGFTLIELIIATLIASLIAGVLFAILFQSSRIQTSVNNIIDLSVRVGVVSNQLEKDLSGVFIPAQAQEQKPISAGPKTSDKTTEDKQSSSAKATADTSKDVKEKPKPIEKIFYSTNKNGQLDTLTFITNNPLVIYVGKDVGVAKPKVVRVQYTLKPEEHKKDSYALFRQESMELDLEKYKNVTPYEVIGGIKKCTVIFTARLEKKKDERSENAEKAKKEYEYKTQNEWVSEQKKESSSAKATADRDKSEFPRIPYSVEMKLTLWDSQQKKEREFTIVCEIPTDFSPIKVKKQDKKESDKSKQDENKEAGQLAEGIPSPTKVASSFAKASADRSNTREIIRVVDQTGRIVYQAEKNENTINEVQRRFGMRV